MRFSLCLENWEGDSKSAGLRPLGVRLPLPAPTFPDGFWNVEVLRLAPLAQDFACGLGRPRTAQVRLPLPAPFNSMMQKVDSGVSQDSTCRGHRSAFL